MDGLKDYAVALTETNGLTQAQRDDVAEKLARDLLNEMRVMNGRKQELLSELMSFVTATEVSTFKGMVQIISKLEWRNKKGATSIFIRRESTKIEEGG